MPRHLKFTRKRIMKSCKGDMMVAPAETSREPLPWRYTSPADILTSLLGRGPGRASRDSLIRTCSQRGWTRPVCRECLGFLAF
jgi:hypothetical protein